MNIIPVIMAGGSGTRLWPVSRRDYPKPFLSLTPQEGSLLQITCRRLNGMKEVSSPLIVAGEAHRFIIERQLRAAGIAGCRIILEPEGKNTAPTAGLAAYHIKEEQGTEDAVMVLMPADHYIEDEKRLQEAVLLAANRATAGGLGTFGVKPRFAYDGYGYIRVGKKSDGIQKVRQFVEKPTMQKAREYIDSGEYYWNSGIFVWSLSFFLNSLQAHAPDIAAGCQTAIRERQKDLGFTRVGDVFKKVRSQSIDYALMEKEADVFLVPLDQAWSDIGTWKSVADIRQNLQNGDEHGNIILGEEESEGEGKVVDGKNVFISAGKNRIIATVGVDDLMVADTQDATLIVHRDKSEEVKTLVEEMRKEKREQADMQYRSHRPWGWYESLIKRTGFQVKRLAVYPGAALSLQSHRRRSEHWVVVRGEAEVTCNEKIFRLKKNESTYIPMHAKHRLKNPGKELLVVIEIQNGDYLEEDDIVRYDDVYGRKE